MKLAVEYPYVVERFKWAKEYYAENIIAHATKVKASGEYQDFVKRIAWDIARTSIPVCTLCEWYSKYNCIDDHKTTLFKKALKEVFPEIYTM